MDKYYYLVSELPFLIFEKIPAITSDYFLQEAEKWMNTEDLSLLKKVDINDIAAREEDLGVLKEYKDFELNLRRDIEGLRKARQSESEYTPSFFPLASLKEENPLAVEKKLLKLRWEFIEEREYLHHFDLTILILYFLKLQILMRLFSFDKTKGIEKFAKVCEVT